jgi:UrcA family protein
MAMKLTVAIGFASLLLSGAAHAEQAMVVKVRDLNLHTTAGAFLALQRLDDAASAFCSPGPRRGPREMDVTTLKCRRDLATRAAIKLGSPEVSQLQSQLGSMRVLAAREAYGTAEPSSGSRR